MSALRELAAGSTFGRYTIVRPIGSGGMAAVYEARHVDLQKAVALKVLHAHLALRIDVVQRFVLEARAASRLSHPHVVAISDIGAQAGVPFMAMDLLVGEPLAAAVDRDGPLAIERLAEVMLPVLSAVAAAHEAGVLHRDLKPDNVFLARRRRAEHPVLLDFGISKVDSGGPAHPLTAAGDLLGTPPYMSPEQVQHGMARFDAKSDQYALGVVLYECAAGRLPFSSEPSIEALMRAIARGGAPLPSSFVPGIPPAFDAIVARAMALEPRDRFASLVEVGRALLPFVGPRARALWGEEFEVAAPHPELRDPPVALGPRELGPLPLFDFVPEAELARLAAVARARRYTAGAALFDQGAPAGSCFVLVSGEVELSRTHAADTWVLEARGPGAVLGLAALWDDAPRAVSAIARHDAVALEIDRAALERIGRACPIVADRLHDESAAVASRRLRDATELEVELLDRPSPDTHREALVRLSAAVGEWSVALPRRPGARRRPAD